MFHVGGRTGGQIDMTNVIVSLRNCFANAPRKVLTIKVFNIHEQKRNMSAIHYSGRYACCVKAFQTKFIEYPHIAALSFYQVQSLSTVPNFSVHIQ